MLGLAAVYFGAAKLGLTMAFVAEQVTAVWPPTGIALAALLACGTRVWPGVALGAFLANATTHAPLAVAGGIAAGNTLEALAGAWLLRRFVGFDLRLERLKSVLGLVVLAAAVSTTASATVGVTSLCLGGVQPWAAYGPLWLVWWLGDATGDLVMAPLLLTRAAGRRGHRREGRPVEAAALAVTLVGVAMVVFGGFFARESTAHPLVYFIFPFVIWAALRFGQAGTAAVTFIASGIAIWGTVNGRGPFAKEGVSESLILLQFFMAVVAVTGLLLGAAIAETRRAGRRAAAQYATARILAGSRSIDDAYTQLLEAVCRNLEWDLGGVWTAGQGGTELRLAGLWHAPTRPVPAFEAESRRRRFAPGSGLPGRVWAAAKPVWLADVTGETNFPRAAAAAREGLHGAFGIPIIVGGEVHGVMEFFSGEVRPPDDELLEAMAALGHQVGQFIERTRAEEARLVTEARKAAILEGALDSIITIDQDRRVIEWNPAAERTFGYGWGEAVGRPLGELIVPPHLREGHRGGMDRYLGTGEGPPLGKRVQTTAMRKGGAEFPVELTITAVRFGDTRLFTAYLSDITERKAAERRQTLLVEAGRILGSSLDYQATLTSVCGLVVPVFADWCALDLLGDGGEVHRLAVAHKDPAGLAFAQDLRRCYPPREGDDRGLMRVLRTGEPAFHPVLTDDLLAGGAREPEHLEVLRALGLHSVIIVPLTARGRTLGAMTLITAGSSRHFVEEDLRLALELGSRAALAVDNARLFSEREQAAGRREEALALHRSIEEQLTLLVEASGGLSASLDLASVLTAILDLSRRLVAADAYAVWRHDAATDHWRIGVASGLSEEYQRSTIRVLQETPSMPETPLVAEDVLATPLLGERERAFEREGIRSLLAVPLRVRGLTNGTLVFYYRRPHRFSEVEVRVATALSNLAAAAIGTAELYEELKANDRRKDEFLAMLAHELRNPLAAVNNAVTVLKESRDPESWGWASDVVERQVKQLARLIDDLLDVSRITSGKIRLRRDHVDAGPVLDQAVETVQPLVEERGHELLVSIDRGGLPLWADPTRLEQVVVNLLTNAAKYTDPGGRIWLTAGRDGQDVVITVRDTGDGIPPDMIPEMFKLFVQGERSIARSEGGLGIGLTVVQKLAEMHGGGVTASSEGVGKGSTFAVRIPLARRPPAKTDGVDAPPKKESQELSRILVVDDHPDTARGMARLLKLRGNEVAVAHDGPSAVETARTFRPAFVLLDIGLPGMDGYAVAATLRQDAGLTGTVIIGVSGYGQEEDRRRSRAAGFDHHLVKPVDFDTLVSLLTTHAAAGRSDLRAAATPGDG
jgi:PAS domain S-box-containing protein